MTDCPLCRARSPVYDMNNVCCRVRFLIGLPNRDFRRAWLQRWRERDGHEMADAVKTALMAHKAAASSRIN